VSLHCLCPASHYLNLPAEPHDILFIHRNYQQIANRGCKIIQRMEAGEDIFAELGEVVEEEEDDDNAAINEGSWSEEEKRRFLVGLKKYGKGNWVDIAKVVKTR